MYSVNNNKLNYLQENTESYASVLATKVSEIVSQCCQPLDDYMGKVKGLLSTGNTITDEQLDDMTLTIPTLLYFVSECQESVGLKEDIAKSIRSEAFYNEFKKITGTVADRTAVAELAVQEETLCNLIYQRAYKQIKNRCDFALETLQSVKKVLSRRIQSFDQSACDSPIQMSVNKNKHRQKI